MCSMRSTAENAVLDPVIRLAGPQRAQVAWTHADPIAELARQLGDEPLSFLALFVTPQADFAKIVASASERYPDTEVVACTTGGEIGIDGYEEGQVLAIGLPSESFAATSLLIKDIDNLDAQPLIDQIAVKRVALQERFPEMENGFAFLMVDGLSMCEDTLAASISPALRDMPLFGGSAGDGTDFGRTLVSLNGTVTQTAGVLTMVRSTYKTQVFSLNHLVPTDQRMVVTKAVPMKRIVETINAEPAAREYARIVGKDPNQLDRFTFAAYPVVVRIGGTHHVRAIQQVNSDGHLVFYSAVDEGMVLTVATSLDMAEHLEMKMAELSQNGQPECIIGCDCILRRIEAEQTQQKREVGTILAKNNVIGFSTYGEQIGPLHVNHTMSGVAFFNPDGAAREA